MVATPLEVAVFVALLVESYPSRSFIKKTLSFPNVGKIAHTNKSDDSVIEEEMAVLVVRWWW